MFTQEEMAVWAWMASRGIGSAISGLSRMVGKELRVNSLDPRRLQARNAAMLLGGPEEPAVGVYLTVDGDATGHLTLMHDPQMACQIIDLSADQPPGTTALEDMDMRTLGEMGATMGSAFLHSLADATDLTLALSPPAVMVDLAGTILYTAMKDDLDGQEDVLAANVAFGSAEHEIKGTLLVLPATDFLRAILDHSRVR
jgi:chemotaxis protein CheC